HCSSRKCATKHLKKLSKNFLSHFSGIFIEVYGDTNTQLAHLNYLPYVQQSQTWQKHGKNTIHAFLQHFH
ncbi:unnamed protein product, partial [Staurois parvus]